MDLCLLFEWRNFYKHLWICVCNLYINYSIYRNIWYYQIKSKYHKFFFDGAIFLQIMYEWRDKWFSITAKVRQKKVIGCIDVIFLMKNQVFTMAFSCRKNTLTIVIVHRKRYLVDQLPRLKFYFWRQGKYLWWFLVVEKNTLTAALVRRKLHLVVQLPRMKLNLRRQLLSTYDGVMLSK